MLVLGAIPEIQLQRLRRAAPAWFALAHAATWETALATIRARPVELAVVDPLLSGTASAKEIEQLRHLFPSLPLILYTALTPPTAAVLRALGQQGVRHVVFARYDDHPGHLRHVLVAEEGRATSQQLLEQFAWALAPLPSELRWVLEEVLRAPAEVQSVQQVAARARVDRRTFERWFTRVGRPPPRERHAAARPDRGRRTPAAGGAAARAGARRVPGAGGWQRRVGVRAAGGGARGRRAARRPPSDDVRARALPCHPQPLAGAGRAHRHHDGRRRSGGGAGVAGAQPLHGASQAVQPAGHLHMAAHGVARA